MIVSVCPWRIKIPDSNSYVCVNCNDHRLYEDFSADISNPMQTQSSVIINKIKSNGNKKLNESVRESEDVIV